MITIPIGQKTIKIEYEDIEEDIYKLIDKEGNPLEGELKVKDGDTVKKGDILFANGKKGKITAKKGGVVKLEKNKIFVAGQSDKVAEYLIPPGYGLAIESGDLVTKGDVLTDGSVDLHALYKYKGKKAVESYILKEIQHIYTTQAGTKLNDKHIEVVLRQMFSRVLVKDAGDTNLLPGEIAEKAEVLLENERVVEQRKEAIFEELFLGISKVSLSSSSFLSAAC